MDFVFYDVETSGISTTFDQPLQFAAILTDENLAEKERINIRCRLAPHILPSPQALLVTGVSPNLLNDPELPTLFEFSQQVNELTMRWAPAIWVGYNSIRFDEEVLRQTFYQNLAPNVYATQFNGNTRFDILTAVYATYVRDPDVFTWPVDDNARRIFKLDRMAPANGFSIHKAHDALGDVEATIHLARLIKSANPMLWKELLGNVHKKQVQARLESFQPYELVTRLGGGDPQSFIGCFCGYSRDNNSQARFFNLEAADPEELIGKSDEELLLTLDETPKSILSISTNKSPALFEIDEPTAEQLRRTSMLAKNPEFLQRLGRAMDERLTREPDSASKPVERQIYGGFYSRFDKDLLQEFQQATWPRRQEIIASLSDPRLQQLGRRLVAFYSPELLSAEELERFKNYLKEKWSAPDDPETEWATFAKIQGKLHEARAQGEADSQMLDAIERFVEEWGAMSQVV